jgi:arginine/lysine/ornithine decarboxylase
MHATMLEAPGLFAEATGAKETLFSTNGSSLSVHARS